MLVDSGCVGENNDSLVWSRSAHPTSIVLFGHETGIVISFGQCCFTYIGEWIADQSFVRLWFTKFLIRGIVPWKCDVEHAIEKPFVDVTDVADRDLIIDISQGVWFPQRDPMI
jgi:hypothetical protein